MNVAVEFGRRMTMPMLAFIYHMIVGMGMFYYVGVGGAVVGMGDHMGVEMLVIVAQSLVNDHTGSHQHYQ